MPNEFDAALSHFTPDPKALAEARKKRLKKADSYEQGYREGQQIREEQERAAKLQLQEQERLDQERAKAEAQQANLERKQRLADTERAYAREGRPTRTDAMGEIFTVDDDETWQRKQADKKIAEDLKAQSRADAAFRKSEAVRLNQAETKLKAGLDDFDTAEAIGSQAVSAKASQIISLSQQIKHLSDNAVTEEDLAKLETLQQQLYAAREEKTFLENSERTLKVAKLNKQQELKPELDAIQQKRDVLPITTAPVIPKGAGVTLQNTVSTATPTPASADPERAAAVLRTQITVLREKGDFARADALERRLVNPAKWEAEQKAFRQTATPEQLAQTVQAGSAEIEQQWQATQQTYAVLNQQRQAYLDRMERAAAKNATLLEQPYSDGDVAIIRDETTGEETRWHKAAAVEYNSALQGLNSWQQDNQEKIDLLDLNRQQLQIEAENLRKHENQLRYLGREQQRQQDGENSAKLNALRQIPGMAEFADETERRSAEFKQRQVEIERKYAPLAAPAADETTVQEAPEEFARKNESRALQKAAALRALQEEAKASDISMQERMAAKEQNIATLYTDWAKDMNVTDWQSEDSVTPRLQQEAKARGLTEQEARKFLDYARKADWTRPLVGPASRGDMRGGQDHGPVDIWTGIDDGIQALIDGKRVDEPSRNLPNGTLSINPDLHLDKNAYMQAVQDASSSPQAKKIAREQFTKLHELAGAQAVAALENEAYIPGLPDFNNWRAEKLQSSPDFARKSLGNQALEFLAEMKARPTTAKYADIITRKVSGGLFQVGSMIYGAGALATGNEWMAQKAGEGLQLSDMLSGQVAAKGGADTVWMRSTGLLSELVPQLLPMMAGGGLLTLGGRISPMVAASIMGGVQTSGLQYASTYPTLRAQINPATGQPYTHLEAWKRAAPGAVASGIVTGLLTSLGGKTGGEAALAGMMSQAGREAARKALRESYKNVWATMKTITGHGIGEYLEEAPDELFSQISEEISTKGSSANLGKVIAGWIEMQPELMLAVTAMGSGAGTVGDLVNRKANQQSLLAEDLAAADAEITNYQDETADTTENDHRRNRAALAKAIAQGVGLDGIEEVILNSAGWTRKDKDGVTRADGSLTKIKDYQGPNVLDVDSAGKVKLDKTYVSKLAEVMPVTAGLVGSKQTTWHKPGQIEEPKTPTTQEPGTKNQEPANISPAPATPAPSAKPSSGEVGPRTPAGTSQTRGTSAQGAAPVTVLDTGGKTQAAAPAVSGAAAVPAHAPDSKEAVAALLPTYSAGDPRPQRAWEIANHLEMAGLDRASANLVAASAIRSQGIKGKTVNDQVTSPEFNQLLDDLGATGDRTTREGSAPLALTKAPKPPKVSQPSASQEKANPAQAQAKATAHADLKPHATPELQAQEQRLTDQGVRVITVETDADAEKAIGAPLKSKGKRGVTVIIDGKPVVVFIASAFRGKPAKGSAVIAEEFHHAAALLVLQNNPQLLAKALQEAGNLANGSAIYSNWNSLTPTAKLIEAAAAYAAGTWNPDQSSPIRQLVDAIIDAIRKAFNLSAPDAAEAATTAIRQLADSASDLLATPSKSPAKPAAAAKPEPKGARPEYAALRDRLKSKDISTVDAVREVIRLSGETDTGVLQDLLTDHLGLKKPSAAAAVETLRAAGELKGDKNDDISIAAGKRASDRQSKPSDKAYSPAKEFVPATQGALATNPAWARAKLSMLARTPPARRRWAYRFLTHLENTISQRAGLYDAFAVGQAARQALEGNKIAVVSIQGKTTLAIDLDRMLADFSYLGDPRAAAVATVMEEDIHAAQKHLEKKGGKWSKAALRQQWRDLPDAIKKAVWQAYNNVKASDNQSMPTTWDSDTAYHMQSEFLRMLVQGRIDPKSITEAVDASPGLIQSIKDLLADLYDTLRSLIKGLPVSQAVTLDQQVTELKAALEQLGKPSTAEELRTKLFLRDPSALAMQALKNGTVFDQLATQDALFTPQGLRRVWDLLTPEMRAQVERLKKTAAPWLSKKRTDTAALTRDLLTFLLDPRAAEALAQVNLTDSPAATASTGMVRRALRAMSDYFRSARPDFAQTLSSLDLPTAQVLQQMQSLLVNARAQFEASAAVQKLPTLVIAEPQADDEDARQAAHRMMPGVVDRIQRRLSLPPDRVGPPTAAELSAQAMVKTWLETAVTEKAFFDAANAAAELALPGVSDAARQKMMERWQASQADNTRRQKIDEEWNALVKTIQERVARQFSPWKSARESAEAIDALIRQDIQQAWAAAILATAAQGERRYYLRQQELTPVQIRQLESLLQVANGDLALAVPYDQRAIGIAVDSGAPVRQMGLSRENALAVLGIRIGTDGTAYAAANAPVYIEGGTILIKQTTLDDLSQTLPITRRQFRLSEDEQRARIGLRGTPQPVTAATVAEARAADQQQQDTSKATARLEQLEAQDRAAEKTSVKPVPLIDPNADPKTGKLHRGERGDLISWLGDHGSLGWPDSQAGGEWDWFLDLLGDYYNPEVSATRTRKKALRDSKGNVIGIKDQAVQGTKLGMTNTAKKMAREGNLTTPAAIVEYLIQEGVVTPAIPTEDGSPRNLSLHENIGDRTGIDAIEEAALEANHDLPDGIGNAVMTALDGREAARTNRQNDPERAAELQTLRFERDTRSGPVVIPAHELAPLSDDGPTFITARSLDGDLIPLEVASYEWQPIDPESAEADDYLEGHPAWRGADTGNPERLVITLRGGTYYGQQTIPGDTLLRVEDAGNTGIGMDLGDGKGDFVTDEETATPVETEDEPSTTTAAPGTPVSTNPALEAEIYAELRKAGLLASSLRHPITGQVLAASRKNVGPTYPDLKKPQITPATPLDPNDWENNPFGEWSADVQTGDLIGYRGTPGTSPTQHNGFGNTEGNGIYLAKTQEGASFFGRVFKRQFPQPSAPFIVKEDPLYLLNEDDILDEPIQPSDSDWLKASKYAAQRAHNLGKGKWNGTLAGDILTALLMEAGYDSVLVKDAPDDWVVLLRLKRPDQKTVPVLAASDRFYSQLQRTVEAKMPNRADAKTLRGIVENPQNRIKAEELKWSGLLAWADSQPQPLTKPQVLDYLAAEGSVRFEETRLTLPNGAEEAEAFMLNRAAGKASTKVRNTQWTLPGGENHREVVVTWKQKPIVHKSIGKWSLPDGSTGSTAVTSTTPAPTPNHDSDTTHYGDIDALAWFRANDRDNGQGLLVEEFQSKWHQQGRDKGYRDQDQIPKLQEEIRAASKALSKAETDASDALRRDDLKNYRAEYLPRLEAADALHNSLSRKLLEIQNAIPDAPYRSAWPLMLFKRALADAVAEGKQWLGWTSGDTQADRYDLSKQVSTIQWNADTGKLEAYWGGTVVINKSGVTAEQLSELVGKEPAKKLIEGKRNRAGYSEVSGEDLKVGGEGMRKFYDDILVKEFGKYVKPWGGKVEKSSLNDEGPPNWDDIESFRDVVYPGSPIDDDLKEAYAEELKKTAQGTPIWRIDITPAMRESVAAGQALFAANKIRDLADDTANDAYAAGDRSFYAYLQRMKRLLVMDDGFEAFKPYMRGSWTTIADTHGLPEVTRATAEADYFRLARQRQPGQSSPTPRPTEQADRDRTQAINLDDMAWGSGYEPSPTPEPWNTPPGRQKSPAPGGISATPAPTENSEPPTENLPPEGQTDFWGGANYDDYRLETRPVPEGSPMTANAIKSIAPYLISGNKGDLLGRHGTFYLDLVRRANRVLDVFGGAAIYTHFLAQQKALPAGSLWNEWEYSRSITNRQIKENPDKVIAELQGFATAFDKSFPTTETQPTHEATMEQRGRIQDWINQRLEFALPVVPRDAMGRYPLPDTPRTAALYLFLQNNMAENRVVDFDLHEGKPRSFTGGKLNGKDDFAFIVWDNEKQAMKHNRPNRVWGADMPQIIRQAAERLSNASVRQGDGWAAAAQAPEGSLVFVDTSYFPTDEQVSKKLGVMNYGGTTLGDAHPATWLSKFENYLLPRGDKVRYVVTNNFNGRVVDQLEKAGWTVLRTFRGSPKDPSHEFIALSPAAASDARLGTAPTRQYGPGGVPLRDRPVRPQSRGADEDQRGLPAGKPSQAGISDPESSLPSPGPRARSVERTMSPLPEGADMTPLERAEYDRAQRERKAAAYDFTSANDDLDERYAELEATPEEGFDEETRLSSSDRQPTPGTWQMAEKMPLLTLPPAANRWDSVEALAAAITKHGQSLFPNYPGKIEGIMGNGPLAWGIAVPWEPTVVINGELINSLRTLGKITDAEASRQINVTLLHEIIHQAENAVLADLYQKDTKRPAPWIKGQGNVSDQELEQWRTWKGGMVGVLVQAINHDHPDLARYSGSAYYKGKKTRKQAHPSSQLSELLRQFVETALTGSISEESPLASRFMGGNLNKNFFLPAAPTMEGVQMRPLHSALRFLGRIVEKLKEWIGKGAPPIIADIVESMEAQVRAWQKNPEARPMPVADRFGQYQLPLASADKNTSPEAALRAIFPHVSDPSKWTHSHLSERRPNEGIPWEGENAAHDFGGGQAHRPNRTFPEGRITGDGQSQRQELGKLLEGKAVDETAALQLGTLLDHGGEHTVYVSDDSRYVTKLTKPGLYGYVPTEDVAPGITGEFRRIKLREATPAEYLLRLATFSRLTGIDWQAHGVDNTAAAAGSPVIISTQPFFPSLIGPDGKPVKVTQKQITAYMGTIGFEPLYEMTGSTFRDETLDGNTYWHPTEKILATDAREPNFRLTPEGVIVPIDLMLAHYPLASSNRTPDQVFDHRLATAKAEILADMDDGSVPRSVTRFADLHDHVDANIYVNDSDRPDRQIGPLGKRLGWKNSDYIAFTSRLIEALDQWLSQSPVSGAAVSPSPRSVSESILAAAQKTNTNPTKPQIEAENYQTGKVTVHGLRLSIENPAGSVRKGTDANGKAWEVTMPHHYGRILGTTGADKDHVDFFLGPDPTSPMAFVVNQKKPGNGHFDEHKVMLGFTNPGTAARGYLDSYSPGWRGYQSIVPMTIPQLKHWLEHGKMNEAVTKAPVVSNDTKPKPTRPATTHTFPDGYHLTGPGLHLLPASIRAHHGTPHEIDPKTGFSTSKIGTGEGAQVYGWGLYFAEAMKVAEQYRKALSYPIFRIGDKEFFKREGPDAFKKWAVGQVGQEWPREVVRYFEHAVDQFYHDGTTYGFGFDTASNRAKAKVRDMLEQNKVEEYRIQEVIGAMGRITDNVIDTTPYDSEDGRWTARAVGWKPHDESHSIDAKAYNDIWSRIGWYAATFAEAPARLKAEYEAQLKVQSEEYDRLRDDKGKPSSDPAVVEASDRIRLAEAALSLLKSGKVVPQANKRRGNLYTVDILGDPEQFLQWDEPLSKQSQFIRDAFTRRASLPMTDAQKKAFDNLRMNGDVEARQAKHDAVLKQREAWFVQTKAKNNSAYAWDWPAEDQRRLQQWNDQLLELDKDIRGAYQGFGELYRQFTTDSNGTPKDTSEFLAGMGIKGVRYLDGSSRNSGQGTHNYVLFDDKLVRILEKNGQPIDTPALASTNKQPLPAAPDMDDYQTWGKDKAVRDSEWKRYRADMAKWEAKVAEFASKQGNLGTFLAPLKSYPSGQAYREARTITRVPGDATRWRATIFGQQPITATSIPVGDWANNAWVPVAHNEFETKAEAYQSSANAMPEGYTFSSQPLFASNRNTLAAAPRFVEQASRASFNHLDRWFTGAIARQAKRVTSTDPVTAATQAAAAWWNQDTPGVSTLRSLKELAQRELLPETVLPREIMSAMREMQIKQSMGQQKALDVGRALSDKPKFSDLHYPPEFVENPMHREAMFSAMEQGKVDTLPPALQEVAKKLRQMLVEAGREAVKQGRMNPDTFEGLRTNFMPRFTKEEAQASAGDFAKRFKLGVKDILAQRSTAFHITDTSRKDKNGLPQIVSHAKGKWRFDSQQARDAYYEDLINRQTLDGELARNDMTWMNRGDARALRSITPEMLKAPATMTKEQRDVVARVQRQLRNQFKREDPYEPKDLVKDPVYAVMRYLAQMTHDNAVAEFFNVIDQNPDWTSTTEMKGFTQIPDNDRFGALAGKYVRKDIADQVMELAHTPAQVIQLYDTLLRLWKTGKTVLNPATHARNILGNLPFAQFAGNNALNPANWPHYAHALRTLRQGGDEYRQLYETGVLGADYASTELRAALENIVPVVQEDDSTSPIRHLIALGNRAAQWGKAHSLANVATLSSVGATAGFIAAGPLGALAGAGIAAAANPIYRGALWAYRLEDDLFKAAAFFKARAMGMNKDQAAQHVRDWFPYYDKPTSTTLKFAGRTTMPFLSFFRESARIGAKAAKERPLSLAVTLAIPTIITALSQAALGLDDEDMEDVKSGMRGKGAKLLGMTPLAGVPIFSMLIPWRTSSGQLQQIDLSSTHPMADFLANRVENWNNDPWWQAWSRSALANPMLGALYTAATGRDPFGDRTLWDSSYTSDEKAKAILGHAWKTAVPPLAPGGTNWTMIDQSTRRQANKTLALRSPAQAGARGVLGVDVRTADPDIYSLADAFRRKRGLPVTEGNTAYPTDAAGRARKALFEELVQPQPSPQALAKLLQSLNDLGKPVRTVADVLDILDYRRPDGVINPKELRAPFRASLAPEARRVLDTALREFQRARAATPGAFAKARQQIKPTTRAPITEP